MMRLNSRIIFCLSPLLRLLPMKTQIIAYHHAFKDNVSFRFRSTLDITGFSGNRADPAYPGRSFSRSHQYLL